MKIVILGAGALGSLFGALLARAGEDVTLIAREARAKAIQEHGVTVTGLAELAVPVHVTARPQALQQADVLLVTVKTYDMEAALEGVAHLHVGSVLSVQNGLVKNEQLARCFGWERTLGAAAHVSAELLPTGTARFTANEWLSIGELPEGTSARVEALVSALARAGIRAEAAEKISSVEWTKYVVNISWMALSALSRMETYRIFTHPDLAWMAAKLTREVAQIPAKLGIPLLDKGAFSAKTLSDASFESAVATFLQVGERMEAQGAKTHKVSILQDLERGRQLEFDAMFGYAVRKGAELGVSLPTVEVCYRLIKGVAENLR
ncbi:MAG TPA: 2-dehydropantoate 2-reductase [Candidatus Tectomicrobia bacterium]|nr:2-dehydropantoate 2-reductase [Candidatus Tectomicrobia bacterium]